MNEYASLVWAPAVSTIAYFGHRIAVTWLNQRERAAVASEQRNEREAGVLAECEAMRKELAAVKTRVDTFIANNGARR